MVVCPATRTLRPMVTPPLPYTRQKGPSQERSPRVTKPRLALMTTASLMFTPLPRRMPGLASVLARRVALRPMPTPSPR
jgi:hypothetical protein